MDLGSIQGSSVEAVWETKLSSLHNTSLKCQIFVCWQLYRGTGKDNFGNQTVHSRHIILPFFSLLFLRDE